MTEISGQPAAKGWPQPAKPVSSEILRRLKEARDAAKVQVGMAAQRKARARQTIEELKQQMNRLAMMAAIDPKGAAIILRNMARRLAAAVRDYAASGDAKIHQASMDRVEAFAGSLGEIAEKAPVFSADRAKASDDSFVQEARTLRKRLKAAAEIAIRHAAAEDKTRPELVDLARGFDADLAEIVRSERSISDWWDPVVVRPKPAGPGVDLVV